MNGLRARGRDVPDTTPPGHLLGRTVNLERARALFGDAAVAQITDHYNIGDEIGYAAYSDLQASGLSSAEAKSVYERAIRHGIDSVEDPPAGLVDLFRQVEQVPDWVEWSQLQRGSVAYWRSGKLVVMCLAYAAIGAGFRTYGGSRELVMSQRLIERDQVGRRLIETLRWAANATRPDGMRRFGDGFRMTMNVRFIHAAVRYHCTRSAHWDWDDWGVSVDNADAVYTMGSLFTESVVDALAKVGIELAPAEVDDIVALWRYIGHVMGIPEEVNFTNWDDLRRKSEVIRLLEHPADEGCRTLMRSLTDYMCEEKIEGYQVLPRFLDDRLTSDQKRRLTYGLMRGWAGDEICEQIGVPNSRLRHLVTAAKPFLFLKDRVRRVLPHDDEAAARKALEDFGAAIAVPDGATEVAEPDDVIAGLRRNEASYGSLTGDG